MLSIGAHCDEAGCGQRDFLPFTCKYCKRTYCLDHRAAQRHSCTTDVSAIMTVPQCPLCLANIALTATEPADVTINRHIESQCKAYVLPSASSSRPASLRCAYASCANRDSLSTIICKHCHKQFCLSHRLTDSHECASLSSSAASSSGKFSSGKAVLHKLKTEREAKEEAKRRDEAVLYPGLSNGEASGTVATTAASSRSSASIIAAAKAKAKARRPQTTTLQQIRASMGTMADTVASAILPRFSTSPPPPPASSSSPTPTAATLPRPAQIAAIKSKMSARGDDNIAESDRWYWTVDYTGVKPKSTVGATWVNKQWTVGRALDALCHHFGIETVNQSANAKKKLILNCPRTQPQRDTPLPYDVPLNLLEPDVTNGDSVCIAYIPVS